MNLRIALFLLSSATLYAASHAEVTGKWIQHPPLDIYSYLTGATSLPAATNATNNVQRFFESERYLYALIPGGLYYKIPNNIYNDEKMHAYAQTHFFIGRYDKANPDSRMEPIATRLNVSGLGVTAVEYSQISKCLVVAYDNSCFDIIYDDGRIFSNEDLKYFSQPGGRSVRSVSISPDGDKAILATDFGIVISDLTSGIIEQLYNFGSPVDFANILADKIIFSSDSKLRTFSRSAHPLTIADATLLKSADGTTITNVVSSDGAVSHSYGFYPAGENSLIFAAKGITQGDAGISINMLSLSDDGDASECTVKNIISVPVNYTFMGAREDLVRNFQQDPLISPIRDGIMLHNEQNIYLIKTSDIGPDGPAVKTILKDPSAAPDGLTGPERYKAVTTFDGENFWVFRPRQGFQQRKVENSAWSNVSDIVGVNACAAGLPYYTSYSPAYGLVARNDGRRHQFSVSTGLTDGLCFYNNGQWTQASLLLTNFTPAYFPSATNYNQNFVNNNGAIVDKNIPKYIYSSSETHGMRRQNIEDPSDVIILTRNDDLLSFPGRVTVSERQYGSTYTTLTCFSQADFDNNGTMWTGFRRIPQTSMPDLHAELWYWTLEDREAMKVPADYEDHPMKIISLPDIVPPFHGRITAGRLPQNEGLIINTTNNWAYDSFVFDHNNTPEDTSDDRFVILKNVIDENGDRIEVLDRIHFAVEDPYDGKFIFTCVSGLFTTDRESLFSQKDVHIQWVKAHAENGSHAERLGLNSECYIAIDRNKRKWVATESGVLTCISPDRTRILTTFDPKNSPIPDATLLSLTYNPESNSLFIGTNYGLTEFALDGAENILTQSTPRVSPKIVESHYRGYLTFHGLIDSKQYTLESEEGEIIELPKSENGRLQWHSDNLPAGIYHLSGHPDVEIFVNH